MKANVKIIKDEVKPALNTITVSSYKLGNLTDNLSILLIIIGVFIFLVAGLGLFGACCQNRCMLVTYAVLVLILFIMKIVAIALWFSMKSEVEGTVKAGMLKSIETNYVDHRLNSTDEISNSWNYMFMTLDCCGVNPVTGPDAAKNDLRKSSWCTTAGACKDTQFFVPPACCQGVDSSNYLSAPSDCTAGTSGINSMGCYEAVKDEIESHSNQVIGVGVTILVIELLAVIFSFIICKQSGDEKVV